MRSCVLTDIALQEIQRISSTPLHGFLPTLSEGEIASLSGPQDDARYFQISVPVQPGNSGGALVDERGNVVGVVAAKS